MDNKNPQLPPETGHTPDISDSVNTDSAKGVSQQEEKRLTQDVSQVDRDADSVKEDASVKAGNLSGRESSEQLEEDVQNLIFDVKNSTDPDEFNISSGLSHENYKIPQWVQKFNSWRQKTMSDFLFFLWLSILVGAAAGFAAHIFNRLIRIVSSIFLSHIKEDSLNWWLIPVPVIGILLSGVFTRYLVKTNLTHGVSQLMHDIYKGEYKLRGSLMFSPILGSTITLGLGGSAGSEGPIAYAGAAIGSNVGRFLGLSAAQIKYLIGCGAAAGISGIFMSPMGGMLFTLEFLRMELLSLSILSIVVACLVAYAVVFLCNGCIPSNTFTPISALEPSYYWAVFALGLFCGLYSMYYSKAINTTDTIFTKISNPWLRNLSGGLIIGICLFLFPSLYGVGYPVLSDTIHDHFQELTGGNILGHLHIGRWEMIIVATCVLLIKCWACGTTNASGGVSSDFAPTLFAGGIAGFLFATFSNEVFHTDLPIGLFTFLGMAAVMAGTIEAPLMTIFIVLNMGMTFNLALAVFISVYMSYTTVRVCSHLRGYDSKMVRHLHYWFSHDKSDTEDHSQQ